MAAFKDGIYRNILAEAGYDSKEIEKRIFSAMMREE